MGTRAARGTHTPHHLCDSVPANAVHQTMYGVVWLGPLMMLVIIGREGLFHYMQTYFDKVSGA